ncbi:MAG: TatD family hydrolase [Chitinophagaceae bacterium]
MLIDTHCHLYLPEFDKDIETVMERAFQSGVEKFYLPAIDSRMMDRVIQLEERFPGAAFAMTGLHPCSVKEDFAEELQFIEQLLSTRKFVAIGEVGLDYYWDKTFVMQQQEAFRRQIDWARQYSLPVIIHSRNATREALDIIQENQDGKLKGIFHCFTGEESLAKEIADTGFMLGIGGVITYKNAGLAEALVNVPLEAMVLETDSPYLSPVPFRGKRNESSYLSHIVQKLAEIKGVSIEVVAEVTSENAGRVFGI